MKVLLSFISTLMLLCVSLTIQGQQPRTLGDETEFHILGRIYGTDEMESKPYPLPNANVQFVCLNDTTVTAVTVSGGNGRFEQHMSVLQKRIKKDDVPRVKIRVSYVGYETVEKELKTEWLPQGRLIKSTLEQLAKLLKQEGREVNMDDLDIDENDESLGFAWQLHLDSIILRSLPMSTEEVQIVGELQRMYESGDTTVFNVDAFEMPRGTVLLNLVRRLPGLRYENGLLTYKDSVIHEIRLNGESFFAHDMRIALENIENEDLKQFRVYKTQADTLSTDTTKHWVADMITKKPVNRVEVAKPEIGTTNVKNTYHFKMEGLQWKSGNRGEWNATLGLDDLPSPSSNKNSMNRINGSFRRQYGKPLHYVNISYRPNYSYMDSRGNRENLNSTIMPDYEQYAVSSEKSINYDNSTNHNLSVDGNMNDCYWNAQLNYDNSDHQNYRRNNDATYIGNPFAGENNEWLDETILKTIGLTRTTSESHTRSHQQRINLSTSFSKYSLDLQRKKAFKGIDVRMDYSNSRQYGSSTTWLQTDYLQYGDSVWSYRRHSIAPTRTESLSLSADIGFNLGSKRLPQDLNITYEFRSDNDENERVYYDLTNNHQRLDSISTYERNLTNTHSLRLSYSIHIKKFDINQSITFLPTNHHYEYERQDGVKADTTLQAMKTEARTQLSYKFAQKRSLRIGYNFRNNLTSPYSLVQPTTNDDPLHIRKSNPNLKKREAHSFSMNVNLGEWSFGSSYGFYRNSITYRTVYDTKTGGTVSSPENINGNWDINSSVSYQKDFRHSNFSVDVNHSYGHSVHYLQTSDADGGKGASDVHNINVSPRFVLYTKHYDLTLNGGYTYQWGNSDYAMSIDKSHSFQLNSALNYWLGNRLTIHTDLNISGQAGSQMSEGNRTDFMWNMGIEYKVLRDYRGLLKLTWYDILRERTNYSISIASTGRYESRSSGNPHYVLLTFQYKLYRMK